VTCQRDHSILISASVKAGDSSKPAHIENWIQHRHIANPHNPSIPASIGSSARPSNISQPGSIVLANLGLSSDIRDESPSGAQ
jgi:hypothetical protein